MRYVFDTNVLVSAFLVPRSIPRQAFVHGRTAGKILLSVAVVAELTDVLVREKLRRYADEEDVRDFLSELAAGSEWVDPERDVVACCDPNDDKFLTLAVAGHATHIISGDADLQVLDPFRGIRIVTPRQFLAI